MIDISLEDVGKAFGGKDHTTVMSAIKKVEKELVTDPSLQEAIEEIKKRLEQ
jgi:chromosomal replication initiator protein